jgi:hypothetical protein
VIAPERFRHWPLARLEALIRVASLLCALIIIGATLSHVLQLRRAIQSDADARLQTVSRILAKEVNRSLTHTRLLLDQADEALRDVTAARNGELAAVLDGLTRQQSLLREIAVVAPSGRIVASSNRRSVGIDVSGYTGTALFTLWVTASATGRTLSAKLQHCATATTGSYTDVTDGAFTSYTSAQTGLRHLALNVDGLNKYVRVSTTEVGAGVTNGAMMVGWKNY